jgi:16S rRNA (guanine(966)-N(2))-methyltransferase RsmD
LRIINGILSGRRPILPGHIDARPTTDFAREALFNILRNRIDFESVNILDLFAGTGSITYEFASLQSPSITAVEWNHVLCDAIRKNLNKLGITTVRLVQTDVFKFLNKPGGPYDLVFADPPYDHPRLKDMPDLVCNGTILADQGIFILEHGPRQVFNTHPFWAETRHYGKVHFSFFGINNF